MFLVMSDNGTPGPMVFSPYDDAHAKRSVYQGGVNVPLIAFGPLVVQPGSVCHGLVGAVDIWATVAAICGIDQSMVDSTIHAHLSSFNCPAMPGDWSDSVSFLPRIIDPTAPAGRSHAYSELGNNPGASGEITGPPECPPTNPPQPLATQGARVTPFEQQTHNLLGEQGAIGPPEFPVAEFIYNYRTFDYSGDIQALNTLRAVMNSISGP
jgi:hypothetical protein